MIEKLNGYINLFCTIYGFYLKTLDGGGVMLYNVCK